MEANCNISQDQAHLSERLKLLHHLGYLGPFVDGSSDADVEGAHILDAIALALTTGKPGEIFAAAFDKRQGVTLVLAKNGPVTDEDNRTVRGLIQTITAPNTKHVPDIYPFLLSRGRHSIEKQARKIFEAADKFSRHIDAISEPYESHKYSTRLPTLDEEFPGSTHYRQAYETKQALTSTSMMHNLVKDLQGLCTEHFEKKDKRFTLLVLAVFMLCSCRFLNWACNNMDAEDLQSAQDLKRRLSKFCRYLQSMDKLIGHAKRMPSSIQYRWVNPISDGESTLALPDKHLGVISRVFGGSLPESDEQILDERLHDLQEKWSSSRNVTICLHVEIRLLLHLSDPSIGEDQPMPIGCSKRTCLCCTLWIEEYNRNFKTNWLTSGSSGKPRVDWALPHANAAVADRSKGNVVDNAVLRRVSHCLKRELCAMLPDEDEFTTDPAFYVTLDPQGDRWACLRSLTEVP